MSEAVESFNDKIDEIKEDREKFEILVGEFFDSKDINIKELLAEMMLHVIMTRGEELQIKFKELEDRRNLYGDWTIGEQQIITMPNSLYPNPGYTYTSNNTYIASSTTLDLGETDYSNIQVSNTAYDVPANSCFNIEDLNVGSIVENVEFNVGSTVNTKLFEDAVSAMSTWSSTAK